MECIALQKQKLEITTPVMEIYKTGLVVRCAENINDAFRKWDRRIFQINEFLCLQEFIYLLLEFVQRIGGMNLRW